MNISLSTIYQSFRRGDRNGDGALSRQEIAQEALQLRREGKQSESAFFATLILGGADGNGLLPDYFDGDGRSGSDGKVSLADFSALAAEDADEEEGDADSVSHADLVARFGDNAGDGVDIGIDKLKEIAGNNPNNTDLLSLLARLLPIFLMMSANPGWRQPVANPWQTPQWGYNPNQPRLFYW